MPYQLCNHMLKSWNSTARPPQAIIARCVEAFVPYVEQHFQGTFVDMGDWLQVHLPISQATEFLQNCHGSGLTDLLWAFGHYDPPSMRSAFRRFGGRAKHSRCTYHHVVHTTKFKSYY